MLVITIPSNTPIRDSSILCARALHDKGRSTHPTAYGCYRIATGTSGSSGKARTERDCGNPRLTRIVLEKAMLRQEIEVHAIAEYRLRSWYGVVRIPENDSQTWGACGGAFCEVEAHVGQCSRGTGKQA